MDDDDFDLDDYAFFSNSPVWLVVATLVIAALVIAICASD